ncbi:MAG TPA: hypothetical protein PLF84_08025 [Bryobacteraceae bacterium]|nr:hypothetical protein [Bryobacterales bacterium]HRJ18975.1 hypothetical protein [Bryobacteraceae bacterium]
MADPKYAEPTRDIPQAEDIGELADGTRIRRRAPRMRACNLKNEKGKMCAGHLKRWYFYPTEVEARFGKDAELYRCEKCLTIYLPSDQEPPRSGTLSY